MPEVSNVCAGPFGQSTGVNGTCPPSEDLRRWLLDAGIATPTTTPERGFAVFGGRRIAPADGVPTP